MAMVGVMGFEDFCRLFERCLDLAERVPPDERGTVIQIAEACLRMAAVCADNDAPEQNAPTTSRTQ
jgi:hypothetical protein